MTSDVKLVAEPTSGARWFPSEVALMGISVGYSHCDGQYFQSAVQWIKANFRILHVVVADSLQRFHYADREYSNIPTDRFHKMGDQWLLRNRKTLTQAGIEITISRWDDWLLSPTFQKSWDGITKLFSTDAYFRKIVERDVIDFLSRRKDDEEGQVSPAERIAMLSDYILEELAVLSIMQDALPAVEVYPGSQLRIMKLFKIDPYCSLFPSLKFRRFVSLNFRSERASEVLRR